MPSKRKSPTKTKQAVKESVDGNNFDKEYGEIRAKAGTVIDLIDGTTTSLGSQMKIYNGRTLRELYADKAKFESICSTRTKAKNVLRGSGKFLQDDVTTALEALRKRLSEYSLLITEKLKEECVTSSTQGRGTYVIVEKQAERAHEEFARIAVELKELEKFAAAIEETVTKVAALGEKEVQQADDVDEQLKNLKFKDEEEERLRKEQEQLERQRQKELEKEEKRKKKEAEEEERRKKAEAEEEERRRRIQEEEDERLRHEKEAEEERLRKEQEEKERLERERLEEEERKRQLQLAREEEERERLRRQAEEQQRRKEEEEARRLEEEERKRRDDSKAWPALVYELSVDEEIPDIGCIVRAYPKTDSLNKEQFECTRVSWHQTRYPVGENEEVIGPVVHLRPSNEVDLHFENTVWIALPYVTIPRGREPLIRFQSAKPVTLPAEETETEINEPENNPDETEVKHEEESKSEDQETTQKPEERKEVEETQQEEGEQSQRDEEGEKQQDGEHADEASTVQPDAAEQVDERQRCAPAPPPEPEPEPAVWNDALVRDTTVEGQEGSFRFVEMPITSLDRHGIYVVLVTRPKRDYDLWNNRGGKLVSSVDQRVSVTAPKNAFRLSTEASLQLSVIDSATLSGLKERYDGCDSLLGASPLVCFTTSNKPQKPLEYSVANPPGGNKKPRATASAGKSKNLNGAIISSTSLPKTTASGSKQTSSRESADGNDDVISLLVKDHLGRWRHRENVQLDQQRDSVIFQLLELVQKLILLRTPSSVESADLCRIAGNLESSLNERPTQLVVRQRDDDPCSIFIELCRRDAVDRFINSEKLTSQGFTEGPDPGRIISLREGDLIDMSFRDNIQEVNETEDGDYIPTSSTHQFIYNSNLPSINAQLTIRERDVFAQNALDVYRGYVRLCLVERDYQPPPKLAGPSGVSAVAAAAAGYATTAAGKKTAQPAPITGKSHAPPVDKRLLCQTMITIPKSPKELSRVNRAGITICPSGPLTDDYYEFLAKQLGEDWVALAKTLGLGDPAIPRIIRAHADIEDSVLCNRQSAKDALLLWHRSSTKSTNKVEDLKLTLTEIGRNDLAEDLDIRNKEYRKDIDRKHEAERLRKSVKVFLDSVAAVRGWREIGHDLGLTSEDLEAIGGPVKDTKRPQKILPITAETQGYAEQMLRKWMETKGEDASTNQLIDVLKRRKLNSTAGMTK